MGRRKGEVTDRMRDRTHPFQVEMLVPETGLGNAHLIMQRMAARMRASWRDVRGPRGSA